MKSAWLDWAFIGLCLTVAMLAILKKRRRGS